MSLTLLDSVSSFLRRILLEMMVTDDFLLLKNLTIYKR